MQIILSILGLIIITLTMWCEKIPWWAGGMGIAIISFVYFYYLTQIKYPVK
jgi:hypothetical protein